MQDKLELQISILVFLTAVTLAKANTLTLTPIFYYHGNLCTPGLADVTSCTTGGITNCVRLIHDLDDNPIAISRQVYASRSESGFNCSLPYHMTE